MVHGCPCARADRYVTGCLGFGGGLEQRRVQNPEERPLGLVDELTALADLQTGGTEQRPRGLGRTGCEEDAVALGGSDVCGKTLAFALGQVLGNRSAELTVIADEDVGQALGPTLLGELLPAVQLLARLRCAAGHDDRSDIRSLEHAEGGVLEEVRAVGELLTETQVGLVRAVDRHRVRIGHPHHRRRDLVTDELPHRCGDRLSELEDVILLDEAHLDVQLGELRLAVRAEVLVAIAAGDLVVALHAGDHEQLLEQLRALRQGVPGSGPQPSGHQEVAGSLRG